MDDIKTFVAGKVTPEEQLRGGVLFFKELPRSSMGKLLRHEMRRLAKMQLNGTQ